jgi:hypothetical protein
MVIGILLLTGFQYEYLEIDSTAGTHAKIEL